MPTRRDALALLAGAMAEMTLGGCLGAAEQAVALPPLPPDRQWLAKLGEGLTEEHDYAADIDGTLPPGLVGTLYRNGPGLFERDGFKKWNLLDGDGMIRATTFGAGGARFRTRFVRTRKYQAEAAAGKFLYPTWTTPAPASLDNFPGFPTLSQAGVTAVVKHGTLYAFDEVGKPYGLDPVTLETRREIDPHEGADADGPASYKAHTKTDSATGAWLLVGSSGRVSPRLHALAKDRSGKQLAHMALPSPRGSAYFHDFFWTGRYVVFHLHPAFLAPIPMVMGLRTFADSLEWRPDDGGVLLVVDLAGERAPTAIDIPAVWMWHALNAYAVGDTIVADFVGYDAPDHFLGKAAALRAIMTGRDGIARSPGTLRRCTVDLPARRARIETIADGHVEFPVVHPGRVGRRHRYGYVGAGSLAEGWFENGVARIDAETGARTDFHFGARHYVGEPVFVPRPDATAEPFAAEDRGWLLCEVLDGASEKSFIAIFDAARLEDGPIARVRLRHHLPMSFHGWWEAAPA